MSPSSSGTWDGAGADIIDLDRYMRGNVRPSRALNEEKQCDQFIVDAGGIGRKIVDNGSNGRYKHYSHDSGVSDGSDDQRRGHSSRYITNSAENKVTAPREQSSARTFNGRASDSLRAFRTVCEQALLDQQKQIAQVTQLCEQLTERARNERTTESKDNISRNEKLFRKDDQRHTELSNRRSSAVFPKSEKNWSDRSEIRKPKIVKNDSPPSDTSDISSSSRSTKDLRRKDKHRTQECKTYKIIMSKLDELNRRFSPPRPARRLSRMRSPSSTSVSVCDKVVGTEPVRTVNKIIRPSQKAHIQSYHRAPTVTSEAQSSRQRVIAQVFSVDIAPREATIKSPNVTLESVVKCNSSSGTGTSAFGDPRCKFDLEDPVHLYTQAKRLQTLNATTRRGRSHSSGVDERSNNCVTSVRCEERANKTRSRSPSLCSMCRVYFRSLRSCLISSFASNCK